MKYMTYGTLLSALKKENRDSKIVVSVDGKNKRFLNPFTNKPIDSVGVWIDIVVKYFDDDDLKMEMICYSYSLNKNVGICSIIKKDSTIVLCLGEVTNSTSIE